MKILSLLLLLAACPSAVSTGWQPGSTRPRSDHQGRETGKAELAATGASSGSIAGEPASTSGKTIEVDSFPGSDLGAKLRAADAALGTGPGTIEIRSPEKLTTPATLSPGHSLRITTRVAWSATVTLAGSQEVSCAGKGAIQAGLPAAVPVFLANGARGVSIHDCPVNFTSNSPVVVADAIQSLQISQLAITGGTIAQINADHGNDPGGASSDLTFEQNTVTDAVGTGGAALLLVNTTNAQVRGNTFQGISTGTQWWGGDSAAGNLAQVNRTGKMTLVGNQCRAVTACLWGSMGYGITVSQNRADGCADVCFDTEGGLDTVFDHNVAVNCGNGCGAIFFFSRNISFRENDFSGEARGGGLIFIKNRSADPRSHTGFTVSRNRLTCLTICNAFYQEAVSKATFDVNVISNGLFATAGFGQDITIKQNQFTWSRAIGPNAIALNAPSITGGTTLTIEGNVLTSSVTQGANSVCINAVWNDYNNTDVFLIRSNRCEGPSPFPIDIVTTNAGGNLGLHGEWHVEGNFAGGSKIVHRKTTANDQYSSVKNCTPAGCAAE